MKPFLQKYGLLIVLLVFGSILGFTSISKYRLSGDELLTLNTATGFGHTPLINNTWAVGPVPVNKKVFTQGDYWQRNKLSNVLQNTATYNGNMVGYNIILYYFIKLTKVDDGLLRGLSAIFYTISILLVYLISKKLFADFKPAIICALLFALNPFIVQIGHDLRGYSFVTMVTLLASLVILKIEEYISTDLKSKIRWGIILGLLYGLSFMGHYFALYIFIGHSVYALYRYVTAKNNFLLQIGIAFFICALFFFTWLNNGGIEGFKSMGIQDKYILSQSSVQTHTSLVSLLIGTVCFINSVSGYYFQYLGYKNSSFFYVIALPFSAVLFAFFRTNITRENKAKTILLFTLIFTAIIFLQLCSIKSGHINSLVLTRFGAFVAPYFMILLGYSIYRLFNSSSVSLKLFAICLFGIHLTLCFMCYKIPFEGYWFTYYDVNGNVEKARNEKTPSNPYSEIAKNISQHYTSGDTVVYNNFNTSQNVNLYLRDIKVPIVQKVDVSQSDEFKIKVISDRQH